jgi:hypothetical protein
MLSQLSHDYLLANPFQVIIYETFETLTALQNKSERKIQLKVYRNPLNKIVATL